MPVNNRMQSLLEAIADNADAIDEKASQQLIESIKKSKRIFITGAGRSGFVGRAFAMRLMHLGFNVFMVGETTTPAIEKGDLLIAISGSGETNSTVLIASEAKKKNAKIIAITSREKSALAKFADVIVNIRGRIDLKKNRDYLARQVAGIHEPLAPLGTLFELTAMIFLDAIIEELMVRERKTEKAMKARHTNLE